MTITSHGEIRAPDGWRLEWDVTEDRGDVTYFNPTNKDHVISGRIAPRYLVRRVTMFVQEHCALTQAEMELT